ncbi:sulfotransferase domain-containing protein [Aliarcobacter skirrowii]|uniref:sulfotransferase domain-containing protein n=1 Tax=Aliarcobacter skirrowii TaxID=28200 RepID=UPI0029B82024|nr:sulfotransferase domain-containing protein [Aliarcobacter skirrowii]MDX4012709.1 sulfotransferase domain-containing protein [Aliarcobacter skirrowii]
MLNIVQEEKTIQFYFEEYIKNGDRKKLIKSLIPILSSKTLVMHVAAPKSGSTWFDKIMQETRKFKFATLIEDYGRREQEIQLEVFIKNIIDVNERVYFKHQHIRVSQYVIEFIHCFGIKVIFQIRNIFDIVYSVRDHFVNESISGPGVYVTTEYFNFSEEKQFDMIIDLAMPWFFNFFAGWFEYIKNNQNENLYILTYENLKQNTSEELKKIFRFLNFDDFTDNKIEEVLLMAEKNPNLIRKNKAISGRGKDLTDNQRNRILKMAGYYPDIDFSLIGIDNKDKIL